MHQPLDVLPRSDAERCSSGRRNYGGLAIIRILQSGSWRIPPSPTPGGAGVLLLCVRSGTVRLSGMGYDLELQAGEMVLTVPNVTIQGQAMDLLIASMPTSSLAVYSPSLVAIHGRIINHSLGIARLVAHLMDDLGAHDITSAGSSLLAQHVIGLVGLMCAEVSGSLGSERTLLLQRAKQHIERSLGEIDLSPDSVATFLHLSTRSLHRLFASEGLTVSGWVRERRLEHCRMELSDPCYTDDSVSMIGARWGLCDAAHFSRLFKQSFGLSPRAYRAARGNEEIHHLAVEVQIASAVA